MWGGKRHFNTIQALEWFFDEFDVGAETLYISNDYQFVNQYYLRYLSWLCHPANPNKRFKRVLFSAYVPKLSTYLVSHNSWYMFDCIYLALLSVIPTILQTESMHVPTWHMLE